MVAIGVNRLISERNRHQDVLLALFIVLLAIALAILKFRRFGSVGCLLSILNPGVVRCDNNRQYSVDYCFKSVQQA